MGFFDRFIRQKSVPESPAQKNTNIVGASQEFDVNTLSAFDNSTIAYSSQLSAVQYDRLLRDPQRNINDLYKLAAYYAEADPIVHSIIYHCYLPYASGSRWFLTCPNDKTINIFEKYYKEIRLKEKLSDIMLNYFKYGNVFVYFYQGNIMTLPPHKVKIGNTTLNGTPIIELNVQDIQNEFMSRTYSVLEAKGVKDEEFEDVLKGYPPEVQKAIRSGDQYAQLDPQNVFVMQAPVEGWQRYAVPWIASALPALARKELIQKYESSLLNIGCRSFIHATYGDPKEGWDMLPDANQLRQVRSIFSGAMSGTPLAVTNHLAQAKVVQADLSDLYQWPMYEGVDKEILTAGGITAIIASGNSENGSTFASAQISSQTVASRIECAQQEFCELMNKLNRRLVEDIKLVKTNNLANVPQFHFQPLSVSGKKELRETCQSLWESGLISTKTFMDTSGYSLTKQKAQRQVQANDGTDEILAPRSTMYEKAQETETVDESNENNVGRPTLSDEERNSDPQNSMLSKQAKDSADGDLS